MQASGHSNIGGNGPLLASSDKYVPELDGIRAIAVCLVVLAHYGLGFIVPGAFGVTLFFFLSGYLITTLLYAEFQSTSNISIPRFYLRRWLRLTPPLLVNITLAVMFCRFSRNAVGGNTVPSGTILAALFYYTNYYDLAWGLNPSVVIPFELFWSLAVEEHFYLIWPLLLARNIRHPRRLLLMLSTLCLVILLWRLIAHNHLGFSSAHTYMATDCRIDSILYGALLRVLLQTDLGPAAVSILRGKPCRVLGFAALLSTFIFRDENFRETYRYSIQGVALIPLFTAILTDSPASIHRRILASSPIVLLGRLSYSIYLFHFLARTPGEVYFGSAFHPGSVISGVIFTLLISYGLLIVVERPIARLRHRFRANNVIIVPPLSTAALTGKVPPRL